MSRLRSQFAFVIVGAAWISPRILAAQEAPPQGTTSDPSVEGAPSQGGVTVVQVPAQPAAPTVFVFHGLGRSKPTPTVKNLSSMSIS